MAKQGNKNALKHGIFAQTVILPGEDVEDFNALHRALVAEWNAEGVCQHDAVLTLANLLWCKRRCTRFMQMKISDGINHSRWLKRQAEKQISSLLEFMCEFDEDMITEQCVRDKLHWTIAEFIKNHFPRSNFKTERDWQSAVLSGLTDYLETVQTFDVAAAKIDYRLEKELDLPNDLAISEQLDARIRKTIKHLGQLKTMQSINLGYRDPINDPDILEILDAGIERQRGSPSLQVIEQDAALFVRQTDLFIDISDEVEDAGGQKK